MKRQVLFIFSFLFSLNLWAQAMPYQNPNLSSEERAKDLIARLTLKEKAALMCDVSDAIPRLGIKKFNWWSEALHGLANNDDVTVFPEPIGMAASFNDALVYRIFDAVSDETRAKYNESQQMGLENRRFLSLSVWTPNVNIFRDPRWGRGQETYGEDPYLMSRMGVSVVKGLQGPDDAKYRKLLACAKHYAVHSGPEWRRHEINLNDVDPRDLWETYLPAFKELVQQADVRQVMCAYQRLDDEPCCGNTRLLQRILRDEWGYKYLVVYKDLYLVYGSLLDWCYCSLGIFAFTNELYQTQQDMDGDGKITDEERMKWNDLVLMGQGFSDWSPFKHPLYGDIEIGGWRKMSSRVTPSFQLEELCHRNNSFVLFNADNLPLLSIEDVKVKKLGGSLYQVNVRVYNSKIMPTISFQALSKKIHRLDLIKVEGKGVEVVSVGEVKDEHRHQVELLKHIKNRIWLKGINGFQKKDFEWIIKGKGKIAIIYDSLKGGYCQKEVILK